MSSTHIEQHFLDSAALLAQCQTVLAEPTAGLDPKRSVAFVKLMQRLIQTLGITVVLVSHDLETLLALANKVAVLDEGKIISLASLEETQRLSHPFVQGFFANAASLKEGVY